jgi:hypothetical protein
LHDTDLKETLLRQLAARDQQRAAQKVLDIAKSDREDSDLRETAIRHLARRF